MATRDTALASDAFTRADGGLGADWTTVSGLEAIDEEIGRLLRQALIEDDEEALLMILTAAL